MIQIQRRKTKHLLNVNCIKNYECVITYYTVVVSNI